MEKLREVLERKRTSKVKGILSKVQNVHDRLTFLTIVPLNGSCTSKTIPIYGEVKKDLLFMMEGGVITIDETEEGILNRNLEQEVSGDNFSYRFEMPMSMVNQIREDYKKCVMIF